MNDGKIMFVSWKNGVQHLEILSNLNLIVKLIDNKLVALYLKSIFCNFSFIVNKEKGIFKAARKEVRSILLFWRQLFFPHTFFIKKYTEYKN